MCGDHTMQTVLNPSRQVDYRNVAHLVISHTRQHHAMRKNLQYLDTNTNFDTPL